MDAIFTQMWWRDMRTNWSSKRSNDFSNILRNNGKILYCSHWPQCMLSLLFVSRTALCSGHVLLFWSVTAGRLGLVRSLCVVMQVCAVMSKNVLKRVGWGIHLVSNWFKLVILDHICVKTIFPLRQCFAWHIIFFASGYKDLSGKTNWLGYWLHIHCFMCPLIWEGTSKF